MVSVPRINEQRVQSYLLTLTEPFREFSLTNDQITSFCNWFDNIIMCEISSKEPKQVTRVAQKPIAALGIYDQRLANIVLNRNKWVGKVAPVVVEEVDLVGLFRTLHDDLGYSDDKLVDFVDAMVRLIAAEGNGVRVRSLANYLDQSLSWKVSGCR